MKIHVFFLLKLAALGQTKQGLMGMGHVRFPIPKQQFGIHIITCYIGKLLALMLYW